MPTTEKSTPETQLVKDKLKERKQQGILKQAVEAEEVTRSMYSIKALLVGPSGSGKTQSALSLPGKKLLIDYDDRWQVAVGFPDVKIIKLFDPIPESPRAWLSAERLRKELWRSVRKGEFEYNAIIEAGLTSMLSYAMNWSLTLDPKKGLGDSPAQQHWMPQMYNVEQHVRSMKQLPCHYVLEAHVELTEDTVEGDVIITPKATGKMRTAIPGWFNECYWCSSSRKKDGKDHYYWETSGTGRWNFLKSTLNQLGKYWQSPIEIDFDKPPIGFARLLDMRFGKEKKE